MGEVSIAAGGIGQIFYGRVGKFGQNLWDQTGLVRLQDWTVLVRLCNWTGLVRLSVSVSSIWQVPHSDLIFY